MEISYNWLKEYLDVDLPALEAADLLTGTGLEVEMTEEVSSVKGGLEGLLVGKVLEVYKHPGADKLNITKVDLGGDEPKQIVCGAPNVTEGQTVIVAPVNATLYPTGNEPFKIKKAKIRGELSEGMICAEDEIGLGESHDGIYVFDTEHKPGTSLNEIIEVKTDQVFHIGLTPNRSDAMSHAGVARDLAASMAVNNDVDLGVKWPDISNFKVDRNDVQVKVTVENETACPRYSGLTISGVKVGPSPQWMQDRLKSVGLSPINNIVDATNYVLQELGQPLHAFDLDKVSGNEIKVNTWPNGTKFKTLDEEERILTDQDLMISNSLEPMCIAGVFGGIDSGVSDQTTSIFLESAYFNASWIRMTATRHHLKTDAALHFEKGMDPNMTITALERAAMLIKEVAGGEISSDVIDIYPNPIEPWTVTLTWEKLNRILGHEIPRDTVALILSKLDIEITDSTDEAMVLLIPTYRAEVTRPEDVIEEILRIYGFNRIPMTGQMKSSLSSSKDNFTLNAHESVSNYLSDNGFNEMMALSISKSIYYPEEDPTLVRLLNFSNAALDVLRTEMVNGILETVSHNHNRKNKDLRLYEFGNTYVKSKDEYHETNHLALAMTGARSEENWHQKATEITLYELKSYVDRICSKFSSKRMKVKEIEDEMFEQGLSYSKGDTEWVRLGQLNRDVCLKHGVKTNVYFADFNWSTIMASVDRQTKYSPITKYPSVERDLALVLNESVHYQDVESIARQIDHNILKEVALFDVFRDEKKLGKGLKSYAVSFTFEDREKTLTDKEIDQLMDKLVKNYQEKLNATIRS